MSEIVIIHPILPVFRQESLFVFGSGKDNEIFSDPILIVIPVKARLIMTSDDSFSVLDVDIADADLGICKHRYRLRIPEGCIAVFQSLGNEEFCKTVIGVVPSLIGGELVDFLCKNI